MEPLGTDLRQILHGARSFALIFTGIVRCSDGGTYAAALGSRDGIASAT